MKNYLWAGLLGVALLAVPARAHAWGGCAPCGPCQVQTGFNAYFRVNPACPIPQAGPWRPTSGRRRRPASPTTRRR
jgi:hypothetical protein